MDTPDFGQVGAPVVVLVHVEALVAGDHGADVADEFASPRHGAEIEVLLLRDGQGLVVDVPVVALLYHALVGEPFHQVVWGVGDLLVLEGELVVLVRVVGVHVRQVLLQRRNVHQRIVHGLLVTRRQWC